jgi:hypothetical protein
LDSWSLSLTTEPAGTSAMPETSTSLGLLALGAGGLLMIKGQAFSQSLLLPFVPRAGSSFP